MNSTVVLSQLYEDLPSEVNLLAVSKGHSIDSIRLLAKEGQKDFGESRLQEALKKIENLTDLPSLRWHFIGHIQSNKIRAIVRSFNIIHSVHSFKLAQKISIIAMEEKKSPKIMIQVKLRKDDNKSGLTSDELLIDWENIIALPCISVVGLMTIAPLGLEKNQRKSLFRECRLLADKLELEHCSMGMSSDWQEAVEAGSTWIRLGTILFGERSK